MLNTINDVLDKPVKPQKAWSQQRKNKEPLIQPGYLAQHVLRDKVQTLYDTAEFVWYDKTKGIWRDETEDYLMSVIANEYLEGLYDESKARGAVNAMKRFTTIDGKLPDPEIGKVSLKNGTYDIVNDTFDPEHHKKQFLRCQTDFEYDAKADAPHFMGWLAEQLNHDKGVIQFVLEWMGYQFWAKYDIQKFLFLYGAGGSGKSTLIKIMQGLIGKDGYSAVGIRELNDSKSFQIQFLRNKMSNFDADSKAEYIGELDTIKRAVGEDVLVGDVKFEKPLTFVNYAKLTSSMNGRVLVTDKNGEVERRMLVVEMMTEVSDETIKKYPIEKIMEELPGIFNIVMAAFRKTIERGMRFDLSDKMIGWRTAWLEGNDVVKQFLESSFDASTQHEMLVEDDKSEIDEEELYMRYLIYAKRLQLKGVMAKENFLDRIAALGYRRGQGYRDIVVVRDEWILQTGKSRMSGVKFVPGAGNRKKARKVIKGLRSVYS